MKIQFIHLQSHLLLIQIKLVSKKYTIIGKEIEDLFSFEDDNFGPQIRLRFDFIDNDPSAYYLNRISLPFAFENEAYSIVHQMKYKGIIDHLSFSKIKLNIVSYFYFGGIPDEYITNNTVISHCNVIGNNSYWDCLINSITIRNNSKVYTFELHPGTVAVFDFEKIFIYAPSNFLDFLLNTIFKDDLEKGNCSVADSSFRRLTCKINIEFKIGNITFVIGEYNYTIGFEQFIKCSIGICFLDILDNPDGNYWKLGSLFYESFDVLFDYELKKIFFYSTQGVELSQTRQYYNLNKILYFVISSIIMLCGIFLTLSLKNYIKTTK